jgi:hypothetical protein
MAREKHLYVDYWSSYLDSFINILNEDGCSKISIDKERLINCGNRKKYTFFLEMMNGMVVNNIDGSAVARDLHSALYGDARFRLLAKGKHIIFRLRSNYELDIEVLLRKNS